MLIGASMTSPLCAITKASNSSKFSNPSPSTSHAAHFSASTRITSLTTPSVLPSVQVLMTSPRSSPPLHPLSNTTKASPHFSLTLAVLLTHATAITNSLKLICSPSSTKNPCNLFLYSSLAVCSRNIAWNSSLLMYPSLDRSMSMNRFKISLHMSRSRPHRVFKSFTMKSQS